MFNKKSIFAVISLITAIICALYIIDRYTDVSSTELSNPVLKAFNHTENKSTAVHIGNGYVLTADHILGNSTDLRLETNTGEVFEAEHIWSDEQYDIALYQIFNYETVGYYNLNCEPLEYGEEVRLIGNPMSLNFITSWGRIAGEPQFDITPMWHRIIPVDASIVPGMSGGAVLDQRDQLRGIVVGTMTWRSGYSRSLTGMSYIVAGEDICIMMSK